MLIHHHRYLARALRFIVSMVAFALPSIALADSTGVVSLESGDQRAHSNFAATGLSARKLAGRVMASNEISLKLPLAGWVTSPQLRMGTRVEKGQVLLQLDDREAQQNLKLRLAEMQRAQAQKHLAEKQQRRIIASHKKGVLSDLDVDQATLESEQRRAEYQIARARYRISQIKLGHHILRAPSNGVLLDDTPFTGAYLDIGESRITLIDNVQKTISVQLSHSEVSALKNKKLLMAADSSSLTELKVLRVAPAASSGSTLYRTEISAGNLEIGPVGSLVNLSLISAPARH